MSKSEIENLYFKIKQDAMKKIGKTVGFYDYFKYRVAYDMEMDLDLIFIFVAGLMDDFFGLIKTELTNFKNEFFQLFRDDIKKKDFDYSELGALNPIIDAMHKNLKPKIAVVGFSGVGKTTIKNLIKQDKIPLQHIPTISGDIATIRIGKLEFRLFDFAGQDQFKYLWKGFIQESNAVLIITDSTPKNIEKSRFFLDLVNAEVPYARTAIIGNKQDLQNAMSVDEIENILGLKTYPMVANRSENRDKMIQIIGAILEMDIDSSPLLSDIFEKETSMIRIQNTMNANNVKSIPSLSDNIEIEQEVVLDSIKNNRKNISLALDLSYEVAKEIKGLKIDNTLNNHFKIISSTIKRLNNNEAYSYEDFYRSYHDYISNIFNCKNIALKQFLDSEFSLLKKSIDNDEIIITDLKENMSIIMNALNCAFLTLINSNEFPDFSALSKKFKLNVFNPKAINEMHAFYLRILNKFNPQLMV